MYPSPAAEPAESLGSIRRLTLSERRMVWGLGLFVGFLLLLTYAPQVAPGLLGGDSGEFQMAAWLAGLAHPTGYPLYLLLGWLWSHSLAHLGIEPATAMNWLSALFAAAAACLLVPTGEALQRRIAPRAPLRSRLVVAMLFALAFGLSATLRSQALIAEVYSLNAFFLALLLWLALERAPLPWLGLVYGLSLTHHRTMALWAPALLLFLWLDRRQNDLTRRTAAWALALVVLPQLLYLYVPLRGPRTPYLHQSLGAGQALTLYDGSFQAFWDHVMGTVFRGALGSGGTPVERLVLVARLWSDQFANIWVAVALALVGLVGVAWLLGHRRWALLALLGLGALATVGFGAAYGIGDVEVMFIPAWLAILLLAEAAVSVWAARSWTVTAGAIAMLLLLAVAAPLTAWRAPRTEGSSVRAQWEDLLATQPPAGAILVSNDRNEIVPLWYLQFVEGQRPDLLGLFPLITQRPEHADVGGVVETALATGRPIRLIKPMPGLSLRFELAPAEGPLVAVTGPANAPAAPSLESGPAPELSVSGWSVEVGAGGQDRTLRPGEALTVTLAWHVTGPLPANLTTYIHLLDPSGTLVAQSDQQAGGVYYPSQLWPEGATLRDRHRLDLPLSLAPGLYQLRVGAYSHGPTGLTRLGREITVGRLTTATAAAPSSPSVAMTPVGESFGRTPTIALEGFALNEGGGHAPPDALLHPGQPMTVTLVWRALAAPEATYTTFLHLVPVGKEAPVAQADAPARADDYPTDVWQPGDVVTQTLTLTLPDLPGRYRLVVGLYHAESGARLPLADGDSLTLAQFDVGEHEEQR